ncbi:hypothetical protein AAFF_G00439530 [Aldrovandia affinis]|uniref:Uncharacterized protein n=1 Tax=Aldrovandia affinis TaxID=143900 RepID=A0AAD7S7L5_9TELE|nr:hypothetical protein AAFF_G00439530 [Aldrovandia affinis]
MTMSVPERNSGSGGKEEESEDESEILEESPCGRWQKRKEQRWRIASGQVSVTFPPSPPSPIQHVCSLSEDPTEP